MALETSAESPAPLRQIAHAIEGWIGRLGPVWVEAQISELKKAKNVYFLTLRDLDTNMSANAMCKSAIIEASSTPITSDLRVVVHAKPSYYSPTGQMSLQIREIRPQGEGELQAQLEKRRQLLAAEGLFEPHTKKLLPLLPRGIGFVTGQDSAAERDVITIATGRWPSVRFVTRHARMQGSQCAAEVIAAVRELDSDPSVDVIVIARGGGSLDDLLPFYDEGLIRAVFACRTPVVSAIGHEPDQPLLDLVADVRASTPTHAAKLLVPDLADELRGVAQARERTRQAIESMLNRESQGLSHLRSRPVMANPSVVVDAAQVVVHEARDRIRRSLTQRLDVAGNEVGHHLARVRGLSPLATLERGYSVAQLDGQVVRSVAQVQVDAELHIRVADGHITARAVSTEEIDHD